MRMGLLWACALLMMLASGTAVVLRPATGMIVMPTPRPAASHWVNVSTGNGSRYNGSLDSDPQRRPKVQGLYEVLAQESEVVAVHLVHVPYTDKYLYMERPSDKRSESFQIAGTFDLVSRNWTRVNASDGLFCSGHAQTSDGQIVVAGGHKENGGYPSGMRSVRLFNEAEAPALLQNATVMQWKRWYPSVTLLPDEQIMIMGGTQQVGGSGGGNSKYELYNPIKAPYEYPLPNRTVDPCFVKQMKKMYYPFNYVLPTGDVYSFGEREGRVMVAQTGVYRQIPVPNPWNPYLAGDKLDGTNFTQFPYTASAAYSTLTFEDNYSSVELMIFGGAPVEATKNENLLSVSTVRRMNISWVYNETLKEYNYTYSPWSTEDLGIPRVMGDATVLPNGDVLLLNGAQAGVAGDSGSSFGSGGRSNYPNFWAQLYQPDLPYGKRVTYLAGSTIARMYHGTAALTTNATILVTGCDRCYRLSSDVPSYVSPGSRFEYRNEIFYPPYWFDFENKPEIVRVNGNVTWMPYNHTFSLDWGSEMGNTSMGNTSVPVTSVSLVAPSSTTHSFNMNQRVVKLEILSVNYNTSTLTLKTPPHPYIAPPQWYMIFAMNGKTMSKAKWIRLVDTLGQGKVVPTSITNGTLVTPYC